MFEKLKYKHQIFLLLFTIWISNQNLKNTLSWGRDNVFRIKQVPITTVNAVTLITSSLFSSVTPDE
jgi:hypothetical protein